MKNNQTEFSGLKASLAPTSVISISRSILNFYFAVLVDAGLRFSPLLRQIMRKTPLKSSLACSRTTTSAPTRLPTFSSQIPTPCIILHSISKEFLGAEICIVLLGGIEAVLTCFCSTNCWIQRIQHDRCRILPTPDRCSTCFAALLSKTNLRAHCLSSATLNANTAKTAAWTSASAELKATIFFVLRSGDPRRSPQREEWAQKVSERVRVCGPSGEM